MTGTLAALTAGTQLCGQLTHAVAATGRSGADLGVSNAFAETDVHGFGPFMSDCRHTNHNENGLQH